MPGPAPSLPDQETVKLGVVVVEGSAVTVLVGGLASKVLTTCGVAMAALVSKTMFACPGGQTSWTRSKLVLNSCAAPAVFDAALSGVRSTLDAHSKRMIRSGNGCLTTPANFFRQTLGSHLSGRTVLPAMQSGATAATSTPCSSAWPARWTFRPGSASAYRCRMSEVPATSLATIAGPSCTYEAAGWVPVDASEAAKDPTRRDYFFGHHDEDRLWRSAVADI